MRIAPLAAAALVAAGGLGDADARVRRVRAHRAVRREGGLGRRHPGAGRGHATGVRRVAPPCVRPRADDRLHLLSRGRGHGREPHALSAGPARIEVLDGNDPEDAGRLAFPRREMRPRAPARGSWRSTSRFARPASTRRPRRPRGSGSPCCAAAASRWCCRGATTSTSASRPRVSPTSPRAAPGAVAVRAVTPRGRTTERVRLPVRRPARN